MCVAAAAISPAVSANSQAAQTRCQRGVIKQRNHPIKVSLINETTQVWPCSQVPVHLLTLFGWTIPSGMALFTPEAYTRPLFGLT